MSCTSWKISSKTATKTHINSRPFTFQRCTSTGKQLGVIRIHCIIMCLSVYTSKNNCVQWWYSFYIYNLVSLVPLWKHEKERKWQRQTGIPTVTVKHIIYLNPWHIMLLHFFHLLLNRCIQFVFKFKRLHVIHVPITVEQISLKCSPWSFLCISCCLGFLFIIPITVIPVANICRESNIVFVKKSHVIKT